MPTLEAGNSPGRQASGFTLLELLVVVAIIAMGTAGVSLAMRDNADSALEREAQRLAALLESARAQSRASGMPVVWRAGPEGFEFQGIAPGAIPNQWIGSDTVVRGTATLLLGPEPLIDPQSVELSSEGRPDKSLRVATDGLRPFSVQASTTP